MDIVARAVLSATDRTAVDTVRAKYRERTATEALSEHTTLHLNDAGTAGRTHLLVYDPTDAADLQGYGYLEATEDGTTRFELVTDPTANISFGSESAGLALLTEAARRHRLVHLWTPGPQSPAYQLAVNAQWTPTRQVEQWVRSLIGDQADHTTATTTRTDLTLRPYAGPHDDVALTELNRRAFAGHPDQGSWTINDLHRRATQPWFDPAGLLLAHDSVGHLVGFTWTKVHGSTTTDHAHDPLGEVYVLAVDPPWQGRAVGRWLLRAALHHLRSQGLSQATLYVDADNTAARNLYRSMGFNPWRSDVIFTNPGAVSLR